MFASSFIAVSLFAASAQADEIFHVTRSNVSIYLNNILKPASEQPVLTINNSTYVPVRSMTDGSYNSFVSFDPETKSVYMEDNDFQSARSTVYSKAENSHFTLRLNSEKKTYDLGEPIHIWTALTAKDSFETGEGAPVLTYSIIDSEEFADGELVAGTSHRGVVTQDEEYMKKLPLSVFVSYNINKSGIIIDDFEEYLKKAVRPAQLPRGTYTIGVRTGYSVLANEDLMSGVHEDLSTEIQIEVK